MIKSIDELLNIIQTLLGPNGCPWDREQTLLSCRSSVLEETCEVIDAIDSQDGELIREELGDLLFNALFLMFLAEKENKCTTESVVNDLNTKLIRRHPHVFSENKNLEITLDALYTQWDAIKAQESGKEKRKHHLDGIPKHLPALALAQKVLKKAKKSNKSLEITDNDPESQLGKELLELAKKASQQNIDAEQALRKVIARSSLA